jgi:DNA-binding response OmpR family regulator
MRVLLVEDEFLLAAAMTRGLENHGFAVEVAVDGEAAFAKVADESFDVIVLDRRLPGCGGDEVCRRLRAKGDDTPVLMLTAANEVDDRVAGLAAGADDYLGKPAALSELVARIEALSRRRARPIEMSPSWSGISLVYGRRSARRGDLEIPLTGKEFAVLGELVESAGSVVTLNALRRRVWGPAPVSSNAVRATVMRLRRKLGDPSCIETITTLGYRLR